MLFCLTGDYTPQALKAMEETPNADRQGAAAAVIEAAGGKLVAMYGRSTHGPGVMVIFDVPDPEMPAAICGVTVASGAIQNAHITRLFTMEEVKSIRGKRVRLSRAYKPPGKA